MSFFPTAAFTPSTPRETVETDCAEPPSSSTPSQTVSTASSGNIFGRHSSDSAGPVSARSRARLVRSPQSRSTTGIVTSRYRPHAPFGIGAEQLLGVGELGPSPPTEQAVDREISLDVVDEEQRGVCQPQLPGRPVKARKKGTKGAKSVPSESRNALFAFLGSSQILASSVADIESCRSIICG